MHPTTTQLLARDHAAGLLREAERERLARTIHRPYDAATGRRSRGPATRRGRAILDGMTAALRGLVDDRPGPVDGRPVRRLEELAG
jgi:hypothetical protein